MKLKRIIFISLIFLLIIGLFNLFCFWVVNDYTTCFYISIGFGNGAILIYALSSFLMSRKGRYIYLGYDNFFIIAGYFIVSIILNLCFALFNLNSVIVDVLINVALLVIDLVILLVFALGNASTISQLEKDRKDRNEYFDLKDKAETILNLGDSREMNKKIEALYDKICSCQISKKKDLSELDKRIIDCLDMLYYSLLMHKPDEIINEQLVEITTLVNQRNKTIVDAIRR